MSKTKEITFECAEVRIVPSNYYKANITVEQPNTVEVLREIDDEDIVDYVKDEFEPDEIFSTEQLEKWAESQGYVKEVAE